MNVGVNTRNGEKEEEDEERERGARNVGVRE